MSYTVKSSEKLRKSGAETETKALLYLMNSDQTVMIYIISLLTSLTI